MEIEQNIFFDEFKNKLIILENSLIDVKNANYHYVHLPLFDINITPPRATGINNNHSTLLSVSLSYLSL